MAVQAGVAAPAMLLAIRGAKTTTGIVGLPLVRAAAWLASSQAGWAERRLGRVASP